MSWLRGLGQDLIDKRLWPIALVLGIAIIAAPAVLARGGGSGDEVAVAPGTTPDQGLRAAVVQTAEPGDGPASGGMRNPFFDPPAEEVPGAGTQAAGTATDTDTSGTGAGVNTDGSSGTSTSGSSDSGSDSGSSDSGSGKDTSGDSGSSDDDSSSSTKGSGEVGYDLTVKFGPADGEITTYKNVPRLSPLPNAETPMFVYMGVLDDGKTAVFLMGDGIGAAVGDGTCRPSAEVCETLELDKGATMFLDGATPAEGGAPVQYQLEVTSIVKRGGSKKASSAAKKQAKKAAKAGRAAVRKARRNGAADTLDRYRFDVADGVIRRLSAKQRGRAKARASSIGTLQARRTGRVVASAALQG